MYKHKILFGLDRDQKEEQLGRLCAECATELLGPPKLEYVPRVFFFVEDPNGSHERAQRAAGFVDLDCYQPARKAVFIRSAMPPQRIAEVVFHECDHILLFSHEWREGVTMDEIERRAAQFSSRFAPCGSWRSFESIFGELSRTMAKWCANTGDYERAEKYHRLLASVDPEEADRIADDIITPEERRIRAKMEAIKGRREALAKVQQEEAWEEYRRRMRRCDSRYDPVAEQQEQREREKREKDRQQVITSFLNVGLCYNGAQKGGFGL